MHFLQSIVFVFILIKSLLWNKICLNHQSFSPNYSLSNQTTFSQTQPSGTVSQVLFNPLWIQIGQINHNIGSGCCWQIFVRLGGSSLLLFGEFLVATALLADAWTYTGRRWDFCRGYLFFTRAILSGEQAIYLYKSEIFNRLFYNCENMSDVLNIFFLYS